MNSLIGRTFYHKHYHDLIVRVIRDYIDVNPSWGTKERDKGYVIQVIAGKQLLPVAIEHMRISFTKRSIILVNNIDDFPEKDVRIVALTMDKFFIWRELLEITYAEYHDNIYEELSKLLMGE